MFDDEFITIHKIFTVRKYVNADTVPKRLKYNNYFPSHEIVFFLSGENETTVDSVKMHDRPNFLRYMPKGQLNGEYLVSTLSPSVCFDVYFESSAPISKRAFGMSDMAVCRDKFIKLYDVWEKKQYGYYSKSMMILYDILHSIQQKNYDYTSTAQKMNVKKAYDYIAKNYRNNRFDYKALYDICNLKHTQFNNTFKKVYSATPIQLVTQMRIEYAKELLVTSHYTLSEIAELCGFENQYYFSTVFKKATGFSPSKYQFE